jgi:UDP-N-acetylglucosamine 4,6-dehydratase
MFSIAGGAIRKGERILVTGGTGSLGVALLSVFPRDDVSIRVLSRDEKKQYDLRQRFPDVEFLLGDVRDERAIDRAMADVDVVIHAASLKYVDVSEKQPTEYVLTNVLGTINVLTAARRYGVRRCVGISSDKAPAPVNTYGMTKALLEKLFFEAAAIPGPTFTIARYGNVVGTRGSVVPFWARCRADGRPFPITDPEMTRFFFPIEDALRLIDTALLVAPGTLVATAMPSCSLMTLAEAMSPPSTLAPWVEIVGRRPGEKSHETLLTAEEMLDTDFRDGVFYYIPGKRVRSSGPIAYTSDRARRLTVEELRPLVSDWVTV